MDYVEIYRPDGDFSQETSRKQYRRVVFSGKRVGILCNNKPNADKLLDTIMALTQQKMPDLSVCCKLTKPNPAVAAPEWILAELADKCDVVITGPGD